MDVSVQDRHRTETLQISQSLFAITRSPAPLRINRPERDMRKHDNRRARSEIFHVRLKPLELLVSELPQATRLEIQHIDQSNEMDAVFVEAVPPRALAFDAFQITFTVELPTTVEHIMLSRDVKNVLSPAAL